MKCFDLKTMLFKKTIFCLLLLLLFACKDQGCTEADDFGEFTTNNLQFPQYTNGASLNSDKSLCDDYNKLKLTSTTVDCTNEDGVSITKNCATSVVGAQNQCGINFQSECPSASYAEFRKACFAKYASTQTSQGGVNYVIAKNDTNNPNFYLFPKADVSVKIRGQISMQRVAGDIGRININKAEKIVQNNNSFAVQSGQVLQIFLSNNVVGGNFFDFSAISGNLETTCLAQSGGSANQLWRGNFLHQACLSDFQKAQNLVNTDYANVQDTLKKIIVYKTPYVENTKATAPSPENWQCDGVDNFFTCVTDSNSEDNKSDALKIDNTTTASKRKLGVGFVLATSENPASTSANNGQSITLTRQDNLIEYYKKDANCSGFTISPAARVAGILSAGIVYTFTPPTPPQTCTLSPMLSVKQEISGWVEIGFIKVATSPPDALPNNVTISIVNANANRDFETFNTSNSTTINLKSCSNFDSNNKCTLFSSPTSPASVFVRKGQTLLIHTDSTDTGQTSMTIAKIKQFGLFVKTLPSPAVYCPSNKFRMQKNVLCSTESGDSADSFCKIGPEKCQILPAISTPGGRVDSVNCLCATNANFRTEWFRKFQQDSRTQDGYQLTTEPLSIENCNNNDIANCRSCLGQIKVIDEKRLYSSSVETVCFDLENYQGKTSDAQNTINNNLDAGLNAIKLATALPENITILPYFSAEKNYGILPKPTLSAFPNGANQKLQLETTISSNSAGKIAIFVADNADALNSSRSPCANNCEFNITSNSSITLRDGEGLKISLVKNDDVQYSYGKSSCNILLNNKKSPNCPDPDLYTLKSGNLMRNSTPYNLNNPFNVCRKGDTLHPMASAYQEIFCYNGEDGVFVEDNPQQTKEQAKNVGLRFELDTENPNIFLKNCYVEDNPQQTIDSGGNHTTSCQAQCITAPCLLPVCNAMKIVNPNFTGLEPNTNIGSNNATDYYTCIREAEIVKAVAGSYNISVAVKNEKDIIDYIDIILTPILDLLYSGEKDCSIPLIDGQQTNVAPRYCEKGRDDCNGKTYVLDSNNSNKYIPFSQSTPPALYCSMTINNANEITNANVNDSRDCAQCRPVRIGEIERIYKVILNSNNFSNAVRISTILMVMFYGLTYLMGVSKLNQVEMANRIFKIGILGLFLDPQSGWLWFNNLIIQPFNNGADYLSFLFASVLESSESKDLITALNNGDYSNKSLLFSTTNDIINLFLQDETWKKVGALFFFDLFGPIYALGIFYIIWIYVFVVANVLLVYVVAKLLMGVLFLVGPVFIVFFLFEKTKDYFKKWMNTIISYAFQQFFVIFTLNFFNMLIYHLIKLVLGFKVCWDEVWNINLGLMNFTLLEFWTPYSNPLPPKLGANPSLYQSAVGVPTVSAILCLYAIVHIMKNFMPQIAELANSITEGVYDSAGASSVSGGSALIGDSMKSIYQSGKKAFLDSYPVKTAINKAKSVAYKGLDKALGVGPDAEKRKEEAMKHRKEMLEDRDSISATANKKLAEFKTQNALKFASGEHNADTLKNTLKTARADFLKDAAKEKELDRGLEILGISKAQYNKLQGDKKDEIEKKARLQAKKAGFSQDDYLTDKGFSMKDARNHSSLAGIMFTGLKEGGLNKGGTLTKSLLEKNDSKQYDPRISRRDFNNLIRTNPHLLGMVNNDLVRENSFYEHSQQAQDYVAHMASQAGNSFKNDVFNPSMNYVANAVRNSGSLAGVGSGIIGVGGGLVGVAAGVGAGVGVLVGAGAIGVSAIVGVATSPVTGLIGGIHGGLTGKGFYQGAIDGSSYMFKVVESQFTLSKYLASAGVSIFSHSTKHFVGSLFSSTSIGVGAVLGGAVGLTGGMIGNMKYGARHGASFGREDRENNRITKGYGKKILGVTGGLVLGVVGGLVASPYAVVSGAVSGARVADKFKQDFTKDLSLENFKQNLATSGKNLLMNSLEEYNTSRIGDSAFTGARDVVGLGYSFAGYATRATRERLNSVENNGFEAYKIGAQNLSFRSTFKQSLPSIERARDFRSGIKGAVSSVLSAPISLLVGSQSLLYTGRWAPLYSPEEMQRVGKGGEGSTVEGGRSVGDRGSVIGKTGTTFDDDKEAKNRPRYTSDAVNDGVGPAVTDD